MNDEIAIKVESVSKNFKLPHEKHNSLKSKMVHMFNRTKGYQTQHALKDVSFEIKKGEFFGIVGRNGSGKSTLLKLLAGIYQPTEGKISVQGKLVPFIELGVGFNPELTGRENVFLNGALLGFDNNQIAKMYDEIVEFAEIERFMDQKLKNYSSGMQVRLAFSMAVRANADILLIDEVLAVGDADFQRKCFEYFKKLKKDKKTVVFVTHDMNSVKEYCDRAMLIDDSKLLRIGSAHLVSRDYSALFMENKQKTEADQGDRWGNQDAIIQNIRAGLTEKMLLVDYNIKVQKTIDKVIYGIHVFGPDGAEITALNNRMISAPDVEKVRKGDIVRMSWEMLNIFNDGKYTVMLTLIDDVGNTLDWITSASTFTVKRIDRSTTAVLPPVKANFKVRK